MARQTLVRKNKQSGDGPPMRSSFISCAVLPVAGWFEKAPRSMCFNYCCLGGRFTGAGPGGHHTVGFIQRPGGEQ